MSSLYVTPGFTGRNPSNFPRTFERVVCELTWIDRELTWIDRKLTWIERKLTWIDRKLTWIGFPRLQQAAS